MHAFNSDGYVLIDFKDVDISRSTQNVPGMYQRITKEALTTNKMPIVINAGDLSPMSAVIEKTANYYVLTTTLYDFKVNINDVVITERRPAAPSVDVAIVPTLLEGTKIADFTIGSVQGELFSPVAQTEINDDVTAENTTWSSDKISTRLASKANAASISDVGRSGDYNDLINKPDLSLKQNVTDNSLTTTSKTVVGAVNELKVLVGTKQDNLAKGQLTNTNLNTLNTNGNYYLAGVSSANNAPTNDFWGMLEVISSVIIIQRATQVGTSGVGTTVYERLYISSNWTPWRKIVRTFS